jgi:hypothetical protein
MIAGNITGNGNGNGNNGSGGRRRLTLSSKDGGGSAAISSRRWESDSEPSHCCSNSNNTGSLHPEDVAIRHGNNGGYHDYEDRRALYDDEDDDEEYSHDDDSHDDDDDDNEERQRQAPQGNSRNNIRLNNRTLTPSAQVRADRLAAARLLDREQRSDANACCCVTHNKSLLVLSSLLCLVVTLVGVSAGLAVYFVNTKSNDNENNEHDTTNAETQVNHNATTAPVPFDNTGVDPSPYYKNIAEEEESQSSSEQEKELLKRTRKRRKHRSDIADKLASSGITSAQDLITPGTPQNTALEWMAHHDKLLLAPSSPPRNIHSLSTPQEWTHFMQRYVMVVLYFSLVPQAIIDMMVFEHDDVNNHNNNNINADGVDADANVFVPPITGTGLDAWLNTVQHECEWDYVTCEVSSSSGVEVLVPALLQNGTGTDSTNISTSTSSNITQGETTALVVVEEETVTEIVTTFIGENETTAPTILVDDEGGEDGNATSTANTNNNTNSNSNNTTTTLVVETNVPQRQRQRRRQRRQRQRQLQIGVDFDAAEADVDVDVAVGNVISTISLMGEDMLLLLSLSEDQKQLSFQATANVNANVTNANEGGDGEITQQVLPPVQINMFGRRTANTIIPSELGWLPHLTQLSLRCTSSSSQLVHWDGTLPDTLGKLSALTHLVVTYCPLVRGPIPSSWGNLAPHLRK